MTKPKNLRLLLVVLLLPLLVVGLGMWALTDRVDRLDDVPAAVVNLDEGATVDLGGEEQFVPFGRLLAGGLTQPETFDGGDAVDGDAGTDTAGFDWQLTDEDDAAAGLHDGTYAAVVVIPTDFSGDLATLGTPEAMRAQIEVTTNDSSGLLTSLAGEAIAQASASAMNTQLTEQYLDGIYVGFNTLQDSFTEAADGAGQLADGSQQLSDGVDQTAEGADQLADGSEELAAGSQELADGAGQVAEGTDGLAGGAADLATGLEELATGNDGVAGGADDLATGLEELATGAEGVAGGNRELATGLDELAAGSEGITEGIAGVQQGLRGTDEQPGLVDGVGSLRAGVEGDGSAENPGLDQFAEGAEQYADGVGAAGATVSGDGSAENPGLAATAQQVADGAAELGSAVTGTEQNPGMVTLAQQNQEAVCAIAEAAPDDPEPAGLCEQAAALTAFAQQTDGALNGTEDNPGGLVAGTDGVSSYAQGVQQAFEGDGSAENPGLVDGADELATGARDVTEQSSGLVDGIVQLDDGINELALGVDELAEGSGQISTGIRSSADGADELATGAEGLAEGARASATGADELATGAQDLADGTRSSATGAEDLATGTQGLADGARSSADGADELATGADELATGTQGLADGTEELATGADELAIGTDELADGLETGAEQVPSYSEDERTQMAQMGAQPITTLTERENQADGATTAIFPFVGALALWLGAFAMFLVLPALSRRHLDAALPMWRVALRSLMPAFAVGAVQTVAVLAVITALGVAPVSPLAVGAISLAAALMFAAFHQALMTLFGNRMGRLVSIVVMALQALTLVGVLPIETAPPLLQSLSDAMPLAIVTRGLMDATLGGSLVSTSGTLLAIGAWLVVSVVITLLASRRARVASSPAAAPAPAAT